MQIKKVRLENFKRFPLLEVELREMDCLVGPNNCGKTTLLQALALFDFCLHECLSGKNGDLEWKRRSLAPEDFYVVPVVNPAELWTDYRLLEKGKHKIISITVTLDTGQELTAKVDLSYHRFSVSMESADSSQEFLQQLRHFHISYLPVFSMFLPQEERRTRIALEDEQARGRIHSIIRNLLLLLKEEGRHTELLPILQRVFPSMTRLNIAFDELNDRYISVTYREQGRSKAFDLFSAGSGFQQFLYLFGFILFRQPTVILLDEPDVHLHGTLQTALLGELRRLVETEGKQILFATHSRELIAQMRPEHILSIEESGVRRLALSFDIYDTLDTLGALDPTQLPTIQAYRRVLVVEDKPVREGITSVSRG